MGSLAAVVWHLLAGLAAFAGLGLIWLGWTRRGRAPLAPDPAINAYEKRLRNLEHRVIAAKAKADTLSMEEDARLRAERSELGRDLEEIERRIHEESAYRLASEDVEQRRMRMDALPTELLRAKEQRAVLHSKLREAERDAGLVAELEDQVAELERRLKSQRLKADAMRLAHDELQASIEDVREGVGPHIAAAATKHLQSVVPSYAVTLTQGTGLTFLPSWADGRPFGRRALSDGTADQFYFAVRVALAEVLLGDLRPPLILDDPFQYSDPTRRAALQGLLKKLGEQRQVLYFTVEEPAQLEVTHQMPLGLPAPA
jgi:uncharacterized protein YhaN